jgi:hypothetical protein
MIVAGDVTRDSFLLYSPIARAFGLIYTHIQYILWHMAKSNAGLLTGSRSRSVHSIYNILWSTCILSIVQTINAARKAPKK